MAPPGAAQPVLTRGVEAASALRAMAIGALGLLLGGAAILSVAYELGDDYRGHFLETGPQQTVAVALAALIAVLGGFTFVRGLAVREQARPDSDPVSVALVTLVTVPLAALALGGWAHTHPPDKHLSDPALPYSFTFRAPGSRIRPRICLRRGTRATSPASASRSRPG